LSLLEANLKGIKTNDLLEWEEKNELSNAEFHEVNFPNWPFNDKGEIDLHRPYIDEVVIRCEKCGGKARRITEIFDSWSEAGSMPFAEYHYPFENKYEFESRFPAQFVAFSSPVCGRIHCSDPGLVLYDACDLSNIV